MGWVDWSGAWEAIPDVEESLDDMGLGSLAIERQILRVNFRVCMWNLVQGDLLCNPGIKLALIIGRRKPLPSFG